MLTAFVVDSESQSEEDFDRYGQILSDLNLRRVYSLIDNPEVYLFTAGPDVHPQMWGDKPLAWSGPFDEERDGIEVEAYLKSQRQENRPLLVGVDRGAIFLNVMNGGKTIQHVEGHDRGKHLLQLTNEANYGMTVKYGNFRVASTHHQAMLLPSNHKVHDGEIWAFAVSWDDTSLPRLSDVRVSSMKLKPEQTERDIETIYYPSTNSLCFQPRMDLDWDGQTGNLFKHLFNHALQIREGIKK